MAATAPSSGGGLSVSGFNTSATVTAATAGAAVAGVATGATGEVANAAAEKAPTIKEAINLFIQNFL